MKKTKRQREPYTPYDRFILGEDERCWVSTDPRETQLNNNILVVGGSGSGKSTSIVVPILLHLKHSNAVGVFTKRSVMDRMAYAMRKHGYTVRIMDFAVPEKSDLGFDPLLYCRTDADVRDLAHAIIHADGENISNDPYWDDSAENLLDLVLRYVRNGYYEEGRSMTAALKLLDGVLWTDEYRDDARSFFSKEEDEEEKAKKKEAFFLSHPVYKEMERLDEVDPDGSIIWKAFKTLGDRTGPCVAGSMHTPLQEVFDSGIRKILASDRMVDFRDLMQPKQVLFLRVSPVSMAQHRYVSLFYHQLFKSLFEMAEAQADYCLSHPVHVICDDFATGCRIKGFDEMISVFREKGISATMLLQSETQLKSIYKELAATTIINNCDTYIYLGGMDDDTCENISLRLNRPVSEVRAMPLGTEYFFRRGQKPIATRRYNPFIDKTYMELFGGGQPFHQESRASR